MTCIDLVDDLMSSTSIDDLNTLMLQDDHIISMLRDDLITPIIRYNLVTLLNMSVSELFCAISNCYVLHK